jgi:hypothetical protein
MKNKISRLLLISSFLLSLTSCKKTQPHLEWRYLTNTKIKNISTEESILDSDVFILNGHAEKLKIKVVERNSKSSELHFLNAGMTGLVDSYFKKYKSPYAHLIQDSGCKEQYQPTRLVDTKSAFRQGIQAYLNAENKIDPCVRDHYPRAQLSMIFYCEKASKSYEIRIQTEDPPESLSELFYAFSCI